MRNRSIRGLSVLAASVAVSTALGLAGAMTASASTHPVKPHATSPCNNSTMKCTNISNLLLNQGDGPDFIQNATNLGATNGTPAGREVNLRRASRAHTNEDFVVRRVGTLGQLCGTGGANSLDPDSYACVKYPKRFPVFQAQFAPDSNESGYCVGAMAATEGFKIRLQRCGSPKSFWVADLASTITVTVPSPGAPLVYFPLEFAAASPASNALVLTVNPNSTRPSNALTLQQENFSGGHVKDSQLFTLTDPAGFPF